MEELLRAWGISAIDSIERLPAFAGQVSRIQTKGGGGFILKEKSEQIKAEREAGLLLELVEAGAPVAAPVRSIAGDCVVEQAGKIYCLYPELPGNTLNEHYGESATAKAKRFGRAIARLHGWLSEVKSPDRFPEMRLMEQTREWALPACQKAGAPVNGEKLERIWKRVEPELSSLYPELPIQLIHRDAHPGNMLFEGDRLTGFIDFEIVMKGPRIFDLCYCGTSLLVGGFPDEEKQRRWPELFQALVRGYEAIQPLLPVEKKALYGILIAIELMFAAFSLAGGDDLSATRNESMVYWLEANFLEYSTYI